MTENAQDVQLTPKQQRFVEEYLVDLNGTQAAIRAGYSPNGAEVTASKLLTLAKVQAAVSEGRRKLSERAEISQEMVLKRWLEIATANPNDLIQFRRVCCRYCFGQGHEYQWKDAEEYERAIHNATINELEPPEDTGGYGFDPTIRPHPKCPKCHGEGYGEVHANDTRDLTGGALALYAGVKQTKEGFEIKMHDQAKALENIARHLGMFNDKLTLKGDEEHPVMVLLRQMGGAATLGPVKGEDQ